MAHRLLAWLLLACLCLPGMLEAQVLAPTTPAGTTLGLPETLCVTSVGVGLTAAGILTCAPVTPAMTTGLAPSGADVSATGQVVSTHLTDPLPLLQGGLGLAAGTSGGLLYFSAPTTLASSPLLPLNAPLLGGGDGQPPVPGTRSGTTLEFGTILGPHTFGKALTFDPFGNIVASGVDLETGTGGAVSSVFGRLGAVEAQPGDYTAAQVTNAVDLTAANVFSHASGQSMLRLVLPGSVSGTLSVRGPPTAGASLLTLPPGTLDFTTTGGPGQVIKQLSTGAGWSVAPLSFAEVTGTAAAAQVPALPDLLGIVPTDKGGLGWTDTTVSGTAHKLATVAGTLATGGCLAADANQNIITTGLPCATGSGSGTITPGTAGALAVYPTTGTTLSQSPVIATEVVTAQSAFSTAGRLLQTSGAARGVTESSLLLAAVCTTAEICPGYQASLGFLPENTLNKSPALALGTSNLLYPTQNAVKGYVDAGLATKQGTLGFTPEDVVNKAPATGLGSSNALYPTQNAVKVYVDTGLATKQATLGFSAEDNANKSPAGGLGTSHVLYPTQGAVKTYVDAGLATKQPSLGFTAEDVTNKSTVTTLGVSNTLYPTQGAVKSYVDTGLATKQNSLGFTPEDLASKSPTTSLGMSNTLYPTQGAVKSYVDAGLAGKQASLGFTPENLANKSTAPSLGISDTLYPTQNAVKSYVDAGLIGKQDAVTWGAGLTISAGSAATASTEAGFLTNGGGTALTCGVGQAGKMQVMTTGDLHYCDGATTSLLQSGQLTQAGLRWNATTSACTGDANGGKLTVVGTDIVCASDIGGTGGAGGVTSAFGRTGVVVAQSGDYTASQVTNAASLTTANVFSHATGQTMPRLLLTGVTSGSLSLRPPAVAGTSILTLPAGTTDFSATGGSGQVVRQTSTGAPLTVAPLAFSELSGTAGVCTTGSVCAGYQASLGFTPEDSANKASGAALGTSNTLYPTQNAVKVYVDTGLATKQGTLGFTPEDTVNKTTNTALGTSNTLYPTQNAVKGYVDAGLATKQGTLGFTAENVANKSLGTTLGNSDTLYPTQNAVKVYVDTGLATKQGTLGFTPEDVLNKTTNTALGTSNTLYPTQNAVKVYVDTGLATKQGTLGFTPEDTVNKTTNTALGTSNTLYPTQNAVKTYVDAGLAGKQASLGFTAENVANKSLGTTLGNSDTLYPTQNAVKVYVDTGLATKQGTLGFTAENVANKSTAASLGTSTTLYPTQSAVKTYVDTATAGLAFAKTAIIMSNFGGL